MGRRAGRPRCCRLWHHRRCCWAGAARGELMPRTVTELRGVARSATDVGGHRRCRYLHASIPPPQLLSIATPTAMATSVATLAAVMAAAMAAVTRRSGSARAVHASPDLLRIGVYISLLFFCEGGGWRRLLFLGGRGCGGTWPGWSPSRIHRRCPLVPPTRGWQGKNCCGVAMAGAGLREAAPGGCPEAHVWPPPGAARQAALALLGGARTGHPPRYPRPSSLSLSSRLRWEPWPLACGWGGGGGGAVRLRAAQWWRRPRRRHLPFVSGETLLGRLRTIIAGWESCSRRGTKT